MKNVVNVFMVYFITVYIHKLSHDLKKVEFYLLRLIGRDSM